MSAAQIRAALGTRASGFAQTCEGRKPLATGAGRAAKPYARWFGGPRACAAVAARRKSPLHLYARRLARCKSPLQVCAGAVARCLASIFAAVGPRPLVGARRQAVPVTRTSVPEGSSSLDGRDAGAPSGISGAIQQRRLSTAPACKPRVAQVPGRCAGCRIGLQTRGSPSSAASSVPQLLPWSYWP